jgi:signal transduction protein with GAF and PtsI domain
VAAKEPVIVSDARTDKRMLANLAIRDLGVIAYLGVPLITRDGYAVGTLCVIDHEPRTWTNEEISLVKDIAAAVGTEITMRGGDGSKASSAVSNSQTQGRHGVSNRRRLDYDRSLRAAAFL